MNLYAVVGGSIWGNRGAEAMVATTVGRVRELDPDSSFFLMTYFPERDRELVADSSIEIVDAKPAKTLVQFFFAALCRIAGLVGIRLPDTVLPRSIRALRQCRALFDVSGVSFHDGRMAVVAYNLMCLWPAWLLGVPVVRLSQAMGPFRKVLNRLPARWALKRSFKSFARGRHTADYIEGLAVPRDSWGLAADLAFAYTPADSLSHENPQRVTGLIDRLGEVSSRGTEIVALVPSSLVYQKSEAEDDVDYVRLLHEVMIELERRGFHILVMPNATREGETVLRNNDLVVVEELKRRMRSHQDDLAGSVTCVDFDINTASIRGLLGSCSLVITSRFHAMVAALALGVPTLVMGWSHKYDEVLEQFDCAEYAIDFSEAGARLMPLALELLSNKDRVRRKILAALPDVVASSKSQFDVLDALPLGDDLG